MARRLPKSLMIAVLFSMSLAQDTGGLLTQTICENRRLRWNCDGLVFKIVSASFGRRDSSTCEREAGPRDTSNTQCFSEQPGHTEIVAGLCDDETHCDIIPTDGLFGDPCPGTYKYIDISYICVAPTSPPESTESPEEPATTIAQPPTTTPPPATNNTLLPATTPPPPPADPVDLTTGAAANPTEEPVIDANPVERPDLGIKSTEEPNAAVGAVALSPQGDEPEEGNSSDVAIPAIVGGVVALVLIFLLIVFYVSKRNKRQTESKEEHHEDNVTAAASLESGPGDESIVLERTSNPDTNSRSSSPPVASDRSSSASFSHGRSSPPGTMSRTTHLYRNSESSTNSQSGHISTDSVSMQSATLTDQNMSSLSKASRNTKQLSPDPSSDVESVSSHRDSANRDFVGFISAVH